MGRKRTLISGRSFHSATAEVNTDPLHAERPVSVLQFMGRCFRPTLSPNGRVLRDFGGKAQNMTVGDDGSASLTSKTQPSIALSRCFNCSLSDMPCTPE